MTARPSANLFEAVVGEDAQHPSFRQMALGPARSGARTLMQQTFDQWDSADPQFVRDFQTAGFDARVFELYLAATLTSLAGASEAKAAVRTFAAEVLALSSTWKPPRPTLPQS